MDESEKDASELTFEWSANGQAGKVTITALLNGDPIEVEQLNVTKGKERSAFAYSLTAKHPGFDKKEIESKLLEIASRMNQQDGPAPHDEEVEQFAAGLAERTTSARPGGRVPTIMQGHRLLCRVPG